MTSNLYSPSVQYCDENGKPYAGGTLNYYTQNTFTPKTVWSDLAGTIPLSNPVTLDADGRAIVYGSGTYRVILKDSSGNQIFDTTVEAFLPDSAISAAMLPVVGAATLAQARSLMGIDAAIQAAINTVNAITGPTGPAGPVSTVPGPTGPTGPQGPAGISGNVQGGTVACSPNGFGHVTFNPPYSQLYSCVATVNNNQYVSITLEVDANNSGADIRCEWARSADAASCLVNWIAFGAV